MPKTRILLTGADSLAGSHILNLLLSGNKSSVRAVVGSREKAYTIQQQYLQDTSSTLDLTIVPKRDLTVPWASDHALVDHTNPFHTVIHTLTANPTDEADCLVRFINLQTETVISFLKSIQDLAEEVKRVIVVTTLTPYARWQSDPPIERGSRGMTDTTRASMTFDHEYILATSQASDNITHDAALSWIRDANARFDMVWITAPSVYGPAIRPLGTSSDLLEANRRIWNICSNEHGERIATSPYGIAQFLDVRDLALACVRATCTPQASNKRFVISAGLMPSGSEIASFLVKRFPELQHRIRMDGSPPYRSLEDEAIVFGDAYRTAAILGPEQYYSAEQTLADTADQIVDLQVRKDWRRIIES